MDPQQIELIKSFKPRRSYGWLWLILLAMILIAVGVAPWLVAGTTSSSAMLTMIISIPVAFTFIMLAFWFPSMRYELTRDELILRYGPVIKYRIPLSQIRTIRRRNLGLTIWSSIRFPGIALFKIPYSDVGDVKMCATSALNNILLIETQKEKYGLAPEKEEELVAAIRRRMEST